MSITTQCMMVNLQIGIWTGQRLDKDASKRVTDEANAAQDAASVNKHTVPKTALAPILSAASALRRHFYDNTLPWKDNGDRLLSRQMYMPFIEQYEQKHQWFDAKVDEFLGTAYPSVIEQAAFRMGEMFRAEDYPSVTSLRRRFYATLDIDAVTEAHDFRVAMDAGQADAVRAQIESSLRERTNKAMYDVWSRVASTLAHVADKLGTPDAVFRDSTIKNLEEILALLPGLNILDDAQLNAIRDDIERSVLAYDVKWMRKDPVVRTKVSEEAQRIMTDMQGFMAAFGGGDE